jgi:UDP-3-O-[3-hydroxymyristoyl] glucosamine N-acyltransferase
MSIKKIITLSELKKHLNAEVYDKDFKVVQALEDIAIDGVSSLGQASGSNISFFSGKQKHQEALLKTKAQACLIESSVLEKLKALGHQFQELYFVAVKDLNMAYARLMILFYSESRVVKEDISKDAIIDPSAVIGKNCEIMSGSYIGKNVKIGDNVKIYPNSFIGDGVELGNGCTIFHAATIFHATVGNNTTIHSGARIGKDGFRYVTDEKGVHIRVPHIGRVIIGNDVEIGANTTIDRGSVSDTVIGDMCKLDNLIQIGHNVVLGRGCFVVAQVGIAGSTVVGDYVAIGGQAGIADNVSIGDYSKIAAQSGIFQDVSKKEIVMGYPAQPVRDFFKQVAIMKKLTKKEKA